MVKQTLTPDSTIQRNTEILAGDIDGEKVMMSIENSEYYGLGKTGSFIWDNIENPIKVGELVDKITRRYNVSREECIRDTMPFLTDLLVKELILVTK